MSVLTVADALLELAQKVDAGLIVIGTFAHSRLRNLFRGSVTQQLVDKDALPAVPDAFTALNPRAECLCFWV